MNTDAKPVKHHFADYEGVIHLLKGSSSYRAVCGVQLYAQPSVKLVDDPVDCLLCRLESPVV